jgi:hypothetical protein
VGGKPKTDATNLLLLLAVAVPLSCLAFLSWLALLVVMTLSAVINVIGMARAGEPQWRHVEAANSSVEQADSCLVIFCFGWASASLFCSTTKRLHATRFAGALVSAAEAEEGTRPGERAIEPGYPPGQRQDCKPVEATVLPDGNYYLPGTNEIIPADMANAIV